MENILRILLEENLGYFLFVVALWYILKTTGEREKKSEAREILSIEREKHSEKREEKYQSLLSVMTGNYVSLKEDVKEIKTIIKGAK